MRIKSVSHPALFQSHPRTYVRLPKPIPNRSYCSAFFGSTCFIFSSCFFCWMLRSWYAKRTEASCCSFCSANKAVACWASAWTFLRDSSTSSASRSISSKLVLTLVAPNPPFLAANYNKIDISVKEVAIKVLTPAGFLLCTFRVPIVDFLSVDADVLKLPSDDKFTVGSAEEDSLFLLSLNAWKELVNLYWLLDLRRFVETITGSLLTMKNHLLQIRLEKLSLRFRNSCFTNRWKTELKS